MRTLRARLLAGYAVVVVLSVVLASGAALWLFDLQGRFRGQAEMAHVAQALADAIDAALAVDPSGDPARVLSAAARQVSLGRPPVAQLLLVDDDGRVVAAPRRTPGAFARATFAPRPLGNPDRPRVGRVRIGDGVRVVYVAAPLAAPAAQATARWIVVARPTREIRGLWRSMLPSSALVGAIALVLAGLVSWVLARTITRPVEAMTAASARLASGDYGARVPEGSGRDEVSRLARAFNRMATDVGDAHRRQREFVANVGHDLRTPLTTVRGFAEALLDGTAATDAQRRQALETIHDSAGRMADLVEELLALARLEGQTVGLELAAVPVADLVAGAVSATAGLARERGVAVAVTIGDGGGGPGGAGLKVRADAAWFTRALANVLDNALRFAPPGSAVVVTAAPEPAPSGDGSDGTVTIRVADRGPGMPPEVAARAFERFFRADPARAGGNSGLGLAIAREIVEAHGGTIALDTAEGAGTTVRLRLPTASA